MHFSVSPSPFLSRVRRPHWQTNRQTCGTRRIGGIPSFTYRPSPDGRTDGRVRSGGRERAKTPNRHLARRPRAASRSPSHGWTCAGAEQGHDREEAGRRRRDGESPLPGLMQPVRDEIPPPPAQARTPRGADGSADDIDTVLPCVTERQTQHHRFKIVHHSSSNARTPSHTGARKKGPVKD